MDNLIHGVADQYRQRDTDNVEAWGNYLAEQEGQQAQQQAVAQKLEAAHAQAVQPTPFETEATELAGQSSTSRAVKAVGTGAVEAGKAVVGAVADAANAIIDLPFAATDFVQRSFFDYNGPEIKSPVDIPSPDKSQYAGAVIGRGVLQFLVPFSQSAKLLKLGQAATKMGNVGRAAAAGAVVDVAAFDGNEERLANLLLKYIDEDSETSRAVLEFFAASPDDNEMVGRLKNVLEGALLGVAVDGAAEGAAKVLHGVREYFRAKYPGKPPIDSLTEIADASAVTKELEDAATQAEARQIELDAVPGQKALDVEGSKLVEAELAAARDAKALEEGVTADEVAYKEMWDKEQAVKAESKLTAAELDRMDNEGFVTRPYVHAEAPNDIHLSDEMIPGAVAVDPAVFRSMRSGVTEAADMPAVFAYRRAQESLFPEEAAAGAAKSADVVEQIAETNSLVVAKTAEATAAPAARTVGDFAYWKTANDDNGFGEILKIGEDGRFFVKDEATGKRSWRTTDDMEPIIMMGSGPFMTFQHLTQVAKLAGKLSESLGKGNVASATIGATVGASSNANAADGSDRDTMIGAGLIGALGALGIYKGAKGVARLMKNTAKAPAATPAVVAPKTVHDFRADATEQLKATNLPQAQRLASDVKLRNISPVRPLKQTPKFSTEQIESFAKAVRNGDIEEMAGKVDTTNFNYDYIDNVEDISDVLEAFTGAFTKQIDTATRGKVSFDEIENMAGMIGADATTMHTMYGDTGNLAEKFTAHRAFVMGSALHFRELAKAASSGDDLALIALKKHTAVHAAVQAQLAGTQTEIARALAAMRIRTGPGKLLLEQIDGLLTAHGGVKVNKEFAQRAAEMTDPYKLSKMAKMGWYARTMDALRDVYVNSALSGPITHVVNFSSNLLVLASSIADRSVAVGVGKLRGGGADTMQTEEVMQQAIGMWGGMTDALRLTGEGRAAIKRAALLAAGGDLKAAEAAMMATDSKDMGNVYKAFASDTQQFDKSINGTNEMTSGLGAATFDADPNKWFGHTMDVLGAVMRTPGGRLLTTSDELFKAVNYRGELYAQAYRNARGQGLADKELSSAMAHLIENPTDEMLEAAMASARGNTFTNNLGRFGRHIQGLTSDSRVPAWILAPFVRTPLNIMHYAFKRSPLTAMLYQQNRADWAAGGIKRDMVIAKVSIGSMLMGATGLLAYNGNITGQLPREAQAEKLGGTQDNSIKIGNKYYAYNRLDPFGMMMSWSANAVAIGKDRSEKVQDNLVGSMLLSFGQSLLSKSYLSGMVDAFNAVHLGVMSGSVRPVSQYLERTAATFVPASGLRRAMKNELDPVQKEVDTIIGQIIKDTPVLSEYAADQYNVFGEKVQGRKGLFGGAQTLSPVAVSQLKETPAHKEVLRLNIDLKKPPRSLNGGGNGMASVSLDAKQYSRYIELAGNAAKDPTGKGFLEAVNEMVTKPEWKNIPEGDGEVEGQKEFIIRTLQANYRRAAEDQLVKEFPELERKQKENRVRLIKARTGQDASELLSPAIGGVRG